MTPVPLIWKSLRHRRFTVTLTVVSIALSVALLLGVERLRRESRASFASTISGTDLIVGARTSPIQLLLASVFHLGDVSNNIRWESYQAVATNPAVAWAIPISLGDSHRGYRVLGTTREYLDHFRYGRRQSLSLQNGSWFTDERGAVLGAAVADRLRYRVGDTLVVAHGAGVVSFIEHEEHPFRVVGILAPTGTPVDQTVHVSLTGIDAIHAGMAQLHAGHDHDPLAPANLERAAAPKITAVFLGLKSRPSVLGVQRSINEYAGDPLTAVMPADALEQLWEIVGVVENTLLAVSAFVVLVGLAGMVVAMLTSLNERRREMAILRSVGARPVHIFGLIVGEAALVTVTGAIVGVALLYGLLVALRPLLAGHYGLFLELGALGGSDWAILLGVCAAGILVGLAPGYRSYRYSLADGLTPRI